MRRWKLRLKMIRIEGPWAGPQPILLALEGRAKHSGHASRRKRQ